MKSILIILLVLSINSNSQEISCNELQEFIELNGYQKRSLSNYTLDSSWLYKVTAYDYDLDVYIVAGIEENEYSFSTNTYIFCGIPSSNWNAFQYGNFGDSESYGERFHKYSIDYICNCS